MMNLDVLLALTLFAVVSTVTPGPNNLMLMSSGANFGFRRSIPHMAGVILGFAFMIVLVGMGLMTVFEAWPISHLILKTLSVIYLIYLAYKIAFSSSPTKNCDEGAKPLTFLQACAFQWVNPKAWSMALTAISVYSPDRTLLSIMLIASIFAIVNVPSGSLWTVLGQKISVILHVPRRLKIFNLTMAGCLLASVYPIFI
jgi:threonine/homoserine/homoserine lactone efflux protein